MRKEKTIYIGANFQTSQTEERVIGLTRMDVAFTAKFLGQELFKAATTGDVSDLKRKQKLN